MPAADRLDSPKRLILSLLRAASGRSVPVRVLVQLGELFGAREGTMRVALTRLVSQGLVEPDGAGRYQLGVAALPLGRYVEEWRLGERRARAWEGTWLCVALPRGADRGLRRRSRTALSLLGFREGLPGLWVRPDNLSLALDELRGRLASLDLEEDAELFVGSDFSSSLARRWQRSLWKRPALLRRQQQALERLRAARTGLARASAEEALVATFLAGGAAIRVLATDPMLPAEIAPTEARAELARAMLDFDGLGRRLWAEWIRHLDADAGKLSGALAPSPETHA